MGRLINLKGEFFGRLMVVGRSTKKISKKRIFWVCQCDCGEICEISGWLLKSGQTRSCGCLQKELLGKRSVIDLTERKFGSLCVSKRDGSDSYGQAKWWCVCDCGNEISVRGRDLVTQNTKTCGCKTGQLIAEKKFKGEDSAANNRYSSYRWSAKSKNLEFSLSFQEFKTITKRNCAICGCQPKKIHKQIGKFTRSVYTWNGIDRIDQSHGYTKENTRTCCWDCNRARGEMSDLQFKEWLQRAVSVFIDENIEVFDGPVK